ncbi:uncharacterized protein [Miscanthus floridulus]|uniref:uncharacterized protein n=1 Tax=Miscanthus floridulus TaxID=154761 RepID=UPI003459C88F
MMHVRSPTPTVERTGEWQLIDPSIVNWFLNTVSESIFDIVHKPHLTAFSLWTAIEKLFLDNELQRTVYLEDELRSVQQDDISINNYRTKLKHLGDELRDIGHPIFEPSQVLNLLWGLSPRYRHLKPVITAKFSPRTFMSTRSFLILEELSEKHDAKAEALVQQQQRRRAWIRQQHGLR